eukprot:45571-Eustigmatos_ZCMA.PRE.1
MSDTLLAARTMLESRRLCGALLRRLWRCLKLDQRQTVVQWLMARLGLLLKHGAHAEEALMLLDDMCDDLGVDAQPAQPEGQSAALSPSLIAERVVSALQRRKLLQECGHNALRDQRRRQRGALALWLGGLH